MGPSLRKVCSLAQAPGGKGFSAAAWVDEPIREGSPLTAPRLARRRMPARRDSASCCCHFRFACTQAARMSRIIHKMTFGIEWDVPALDRCWQAAAPGGWLVCGSTGPPEIQEDEHD